MNILITLKLSEQEEDTLIGNVPCILIGDKTYAVPSDQFAELQRFNIPYKVEHVG